MGQPEAQNSGMGEMRKELSLFVVEHADGSVGVQACEKEDDAIYYFENCHQVKDGGKARMTLVTIEFEDVLKAKARVKFLRKSPTK